MRQKNWPWLRSNPINLKEARQYLRQMLKKVESTSPDNTGLVLLSHILKRPKTWILAHPEYPLTPEELSDLQEDLDKLLQGFPLPYLLGQWEFYGRSFFITPNVLIPRPETELLVEIAIQSARQYQSPLIVDVGTGSGVVAISLAAELPDARVVATDLSLEALHVAKINTQRLGQTTVNFIQTDLLTPLSMQFDLICANLPYIPRQRLSKIPVTRWEPGLALDGGQSGLNIINRLLDQAKSRLTRRGMILLEIDSTLGKRAIDMAMKYFPDYDCRIIQDLTQRDRILSINAPQTLKAD